jgi:hypothetical protein
MEVNTNFSIGGVGGVTPQNRSTPAAKPPAAADPFANSAALDDAVKNLPASRPDAVAQARTLLADPNYPSASTLRQVSDLLATYLASGGE